MADSKHGILVYPEKGDVAVVFLHGVVGDRLGTWTHKNDFCWPTHLHQDLGCTVATIGYPAPVAGWAEAMRLADRATNLLRELEHEEGLQGKRLVLVCHSYGGLVAKQMVRNSSERTALRSFSIQLGGLVFLGTPHRGAALASLAGYVGKLAGSTIIAEELDPKQAHEVRLISRCRAARTIRSLRPDKSLTRCELSLQ